MEAFRTAELASGKSVGIVRVAVKAISAALNAAQRKGFVTANVAALEAMPEERAEKAVFTATDIRALLAEGDAHKTGEWGTLIRLGYHVGGRLTDLARLPWSAVDRTAGTISYVPQKTRRSGKRLVVPMHPDLASHLRSLAPSKAKDAAILPTLAAKGVGGEHGLSQTFGLLMERAKIAAPTIRKATGEKGRSVRALSFHSLRHGFNSAMANAGVPQEVRQMLTGHASAEMNARYTHLEMETLRAAAAKLPSIG